MDPIGNTKIYSIIFLMRIVEAWEGESPAVAKGECTSLFIEIRFSRQSPYGGP
jgi:hypothetical protein